jgi:hypothetical protein
VWLFDTLSDLVIIDKFWNFQIPILYPKNDSALSDITYLSYQTLTIGTGPRATLSIMNSFLGGWLDGLQQITVI